MKMKEILMKHNTLGVQHIISNHDIPVACIQLNNSDISVINIYLQLNLGMRQMKMEWKMKRRRKQAMGKGRDISRLSAQPGLFVNVIKNALSSSSLVYFSLKYGNYEIRCRLIHKTLSFIYGKVQNSLSHGIPRNPMLCSVHKNTRRYQKGRCSL